MRDIDGNPLIIVVNVSTVSGKVSRVQTVSENGSVYKLVINGIEFAVDSTFDSLTNYEWINANGIFFLDYNGVIVGYKQSGFDYEFGYIIKVFPDPDRELVIVKLLNSDGVVEKLYTGDKITINDSRYKTYSKISAEIGNYANKLVRYKLDTDNKLRIIETAQNGDDWVNSESVPEGKLRMTYSSGDSKFPYINATGMISDRVKVGKNTIFFKVPENEENFDESLYSAQLGTAPMYDGENVKFKTYSLSSERICDDICIIYDDNNYTNSKFDETSPIGVVEDIYESIDSDDEVKTAITVRTKDGSVTVQESKLGYFNSVTGADGTTGLSVQLGDVVRYLTNNKGQVPYLTIMSKVDESGELHTYSTGGGMHHFTDEACSGDFWVHRVPPINQLYSSKVSVSSISIKDNSALKAVLEIVYQMNIPNGLSNGGTKRSLDTKPMYITTEITLHKGSKRLEFVTEIENNSSNHMLTLKIPTGIKAKDVLCDSAFEQRRRETEEI